MYEITVFTNLGLVYQQGRGKDNMANQIPVDQDPGPGTDTCYRRSGSDSGTI